MRESLKQRKIGAREFYRLYLPTVLFSYSNILGFQSGHCRAPELLAWSVFKLNCTAVSKKTQSSLNTNSEMKRLFM